MPDTAYIGPAALSRSVYAYVPPHSNPHSLLTRSRCTRLFTSCARPLFSACLPAAGGGAGPHRGEVRHATPSQVRSRACLLLTRVLICVASIQTLSTHLRALARGTRPTPAPSLHGPLTRGDTWLAIRRRNSRVGQGRTVCRGYCRPFAEHRVSQAVPSNSEGSSLPPGRF